MTLEAQPISLQDAILIRTTAFADDRGFFRETYVRSKYAAIGINESFVQDNFSFSALNVLRGLHADARMSKLVHVTRGRAYDVIVDARNTSSTFGKWEGFYLSEDSKTQLYIPPGFLHGFLALTDDVIFSYKQSAEYAPDHEVSVRWNDATLAIDWPLAGEPRISPKDRRSGSFEAAISQLELQAAKLPR
jgi:dTDP-4-dehydrorhamnose 3,5-epimerase